MKSPGGNEAVLGVVPTYERLDADDAAGREVDFRLVLEDQLIAIDCLAQLRLELEPLDGVAVQRLVEEHIAATPELLGVEQRDVGAAQELARGCRRSRLLIEIPMLAVTLVFVAQQLHRVP